jgi:hypothetical protein
MIRLKIPLILRLKARPEFTHAITADQNQFIRVTVRFSVSTFFETDKWACPH